MNNYKNNINKLILLQKNLLSANINNNEVTTIVNNFIEDKYNIINKKYNNKKKNENKNKPLYLNHTLNINKNNNLDNINFID